MIPDFKYFVERLKALEPRRHIIDRCNLTILLEPGFENYAQFLARHQVEIIASMPCYSPENVNAQRGDGVFDGSIKGLQLLNSLGYGTDPALPLHLVYNPNGAFLPGPQAELEADYKRELKSHFGIVFNQLFTITNLPVSRFASWLKNNNQLGDYMLLLNDAFNPATVEGLMCRNTINVSWQGEVFDCDFNQMLKMQWRDGRARPVPLGYRSSRSRRSRNPDRRALLWLHRRRRFELRRSAALTGIRQRTFRVGPAFGRGSSRRRELNSAKPRMSVRWRHLSASSSNRPRPATNRPAGQARAELAAECARRRWPWGSSRHRSGKSRCAFRRSREPGRSPFAG